MAAKEHRREAYRFYRSVGYTRTQANNMKNRSADKLAADYRDRKKIFDAARIKSYRENTKLRLKKPYRPKIKISKNLKKRVERSLGALSLPAELRARLYKSSHLDLDIYEERIVKLKLHLEKSGLNWEQLMKKLCHVEDLGDWFDILGELYGETKHAPSGRPEDKSDKKKSYSPKFKKPRKSKKSKKIKKGVGKGLRRLRRKKKSKTKRV